MDNFINMYSIENINWDWISCKILLLLYFYFLIYYTKLLYVQQLLSFENNYGKRTENKFLFFILSFLYTSLSLLLVPFGVILLNSFEDPNMYVFNLMIVSSIVIILYCLKNSFLYVYVGYKKSIRKTMLEEQESKLKRNQKG